MADSVPAWVIVANTALNGFLVIAGAALAPFLQLRSKRSDIQRDRAALLREKAEEIFALIGAVVTDERERAAIALKQLGTQGEYIDIPTFANLHRLKALVSMYFPTGLEILNQMERASEAQRDGPNKKLFERLPDQPKSEVGKYFQTANVIMTQAAVTITTQHMKRLELHMIGLMEEIAPQA